MKYLPFTGAGGFGAAPDLTFSSVYSLYREAGGSGNDDTTLSSAG